MSCTGSATCGCAPCFSKRLADWAPCTYWDGVEQIREYGIEDCQRKGFGNPPLCCCHRDAPPAVAYDPDHPELTVWFAPCAG